MHRLFCLFLVSVLGVFGCSSSDGGGGSGGTAGGSGAPGAGGAGGAGGMGGDSGNVEGWPPTATVYFDEFGVMAADCQTDADCYKVLGYYHAAERFVQMDFYRRNTTGRLTPILNKVVAQQFGVAEVDADTRQLFSTIDGEPLEEAWLAKTTPEDLAIFEAYSVGVNQWIRDVQNGANGAEFPREFEGFPFDYSPARIPDWEPSDILACAGLLLEQLSNSENSIVGTGNARERVGDDALFSDLYARRPVKLSSVLPPGQWPPAPDAAVAQKSGPSVGSATGRSVRGALQALQAKLDARERIKAVFGQGDLGAEIGSNNWVVNASNARDGNALLSNDPHLGLGNPAIWYIATLDSMTNGEGSLRTAGHFLAGVPVNFVGHNADIAWGVTTTGMTLSDVYVEELVIEDGEATGVVFKGEEVDFVRRTFTVEFVDGDTQDVELLFVQHHGPVRSIDVENGVALTLRWSGQDASTDIEAYLGLPFDTTVAEARESLTGITSASQNFVVADRNGDIGWFPYNELPKKTWATNIDGEAAPWLPIPGNGDYEWDEYFTDEELPQAFNPPEGFIATANNDLTGQLFDNDPTNEGPPVQVGAADGYRHAQIVRLLEEGGDQHTAETMLAIVGDTHSFIGEEMTPSILGIANDPMTTLSAPAQKIVDALAAWDYECPTGLDGTSSDDSPLTSDAAELTSSIGCTAFHVALRELNRAITADENRSDEAPNANRVNYATFYSIVDPTQLTAGNVYWDDINTEPVETEFDIMEIALETAGLFLEERIGSDPGTWAWGRIHGTVLRSNLDNFGVDAYNNPAPGDSPYANDGGLSTVDVANPNSEYLQTSGASTRMVCEALPEGVECSFQLPGGQSGDVDSPNYDDLLPKWLANEPMPLVLDIEEAAANADPSRTVVLGQ